MIPTCLHILKNNFSCALVHDILVAKYLICVSRLWKIGLYSVSWALVGFELGQVAHVKTWVLLIPKMERTAINLQFTENKEEKNSSTLFILPGNKFIFVVFFIFCNWKMLFFVG